MHHKNIHLNCIDKICLTELVSILFFSNILWAYSLLRRSFCENVNSIKEFFIVLWPNMDDQRIENEKKN